MTVDTELKLLIIRQNLKDALDALLQRDGPVPLKLYREYKIKYELAGDLLQEHRERVFLNQRREKV